MIDAAAREAKRKYQREWRAKNKDKVRQHNARYWERRAAREQAQQNGEQKNDEQHT